MTGSTDVVGGRVPAALAEVVEEFLAVPPALRLELLVEFGDELPELPEHLRDGSRLEDVPECRSPLAVLVEAAPDGTVSVHARASAQAPTTRGFAAVLVGTLRGVTPEAVLALPDDLTPVLGVDAAVSPLRRAGMAALVGRIKRQVREAAP